MIKNCLYLSFDGLSDPLGQSQILPYLIGISKNGFAITIISCEKEERLAKEKESILKKIENTTITWQYILYNEEGGFLSRLKYIQQLFKKSYTLHKAKPFELVHCRSYLSALIGLRFKQKLNVPFVFDMRGLWADERIDGNIWNKKNPLHYLFYNYFKRKESQFLNNADAVVMLTHKSLEVLHQRNKNWNLPIKTTIIPCCTDVDLFSTSNTSALGVNGITANDHVLVYTGSIGTWYFTKEVIDCCLVWKKSIPNLKLLIVTKDTNTLKNVLANYTTEQQVLVISTSASYNQMPNLLALAKAAIFFIKPAYSKLASSPTKMAECWAMNLPIITNVGIGDNDYYINTYNGGVLISSFTETEYEAACKNYLQSLQKNTNYRLIAKEYFNKNTAVISYTSIYTQLVG